MDWSLAFTLFVSLLVTYASLLLVGTGGHWSSPHLGPSFWFSSTHPTVGRRRGRCQPGKPTSVAHLFWHLITSNTLYPQLLAVLLWFCGQPLHLHSVHKVKWEWE